MSLLRTFHVLDSLETSEASKDGNQLTNILLKHFEGEKISKPHVTVNVPKVKPHISSLNSIYGIT
jgi:hypothetical protein